MRNHNQLPQSEIKVLVSEDKISVSPAVAEVKSDQLDCHFLYDSLIMKLNQESEILLTYDNTLMNFFDNSEFNHIQIEDHARQQTLIAPLPPKMQNYLLDNNFPFIYKPLPNDIDMSWYQSHQAHKGLTAIEDFLTNYRNN
ncbi:MAG: hypothetical protein OXF85_02285 [Candidatus Saccharibacteria bacterium]|nr:hypothetical protein [Candidatus Saccharibacteria bacterium]MCY4010755.1 hypothetical protein [Candidatus Saccharibacteria bacterium]MCY4089123.1 hypothetical protein [Candidatus Saccharibacteria bacterium]